MSFDAVGIVCDDLKESIKFYELFDLKFEQLGSPEHFEAKTESGIRIMLDSAKLMKELIPDWTKPTSSRVVSCFREITAEKVDNTYNKIIEAGFESVKEPWDAFWGQRYASVKDPNGNHIDIFADL